MFSPLPFLLSLFMSNHAIVVENLSKKFTIGGSSAPYQTFRESLMDAFTAPVRRATQLLRGNATAASDMSQIFWALQDVSFEVNHGEVIGIIGRNGAGKSTLLKILSRITEPTRGRALLHGRVGALLEVGTGFHPELTGRENIFLNGAILGMRRREIERKFDEIVVFADIEKFIDTPAKHYSSGMYMRLAFAVAAHLEPEILIVDEVLAVGDAEFQKKCLGKMGEVAKEGRTVILVSHQMNQIRKLCNRCLWLDRGKVRGYGPTQSTVGAYEATLLNIEHSTASADLNRTHFLGWEVVQPRGDAANVIGEIGPVRLKFLLNVHHLLQRAVHGIALYDSNHQLLWGTTSYDLSFERGIHEIFYDLESLPLKPGAYQWLVSIFEENHIIDSQYLTPEIQIATSPLTTAPDEWAGLLNLSWKLNYNISMQGYPHA